ncbi:MAG: hypothetical protein FWD86_01035 [Firmicutes bacterium]|nr:hypothetical protein [Bacillota bacterium]
MKAKSQSGKKAKLKLVSKSMSIKSALVFAFAIVLVFISALVLTACPNNKPDGQIKKIDTIQSVSIRGQSAALPQIFAFNANNVRFLATYDNFWFNSDFVYVAENTIIVKQSAPLVFESVLIVTSKSDSSIQATIDLTKEFVETEQIHLSLSAFLVGETSQIKTVLVPEYATPTQLKWEVLNGNATIDNYGNIISHDQPGQEFLIKATAPNGVYATILATLTQRITISNQQQFSFIRFNPWGHFRLTSDITLSGEWIPIEFFGSLDGNGHTISNIQISTQGGFLGHHLNWGLFSILYGSVKNLNITNSNMNWSTDDASHNHAHNRGRGWLRVGFVAGVNWGLICSVSVSNSGLVINRAFSAIGGVAGANLGIVQNSAVSNLSLFGNGDTGGIVGDLTIGAIFDSSATNLSLRHQSFGRRPRSIGGAAGIINGGLIDTVSVTSSLFALGGVGADGDQALTATRMGYIAGHILNSAVVLNVSTRGNTRESMLSAGGIWRTYFFAHSGGLFGYVE